MAPIMGDVWRARQLPYVPRRPCIIGKHLVRFDFCSDALNRHVPALHDIFPRLSTVQITVTVLGNEWMSALAGLPQLTCLYVSATQRDWISLAPLKSCTTLKKLFIDSTYCMRDMEDEHVADIRTLGWLHTMHIEQLHNNTNNMRRVLAQPHTLEWKQIGFICDDLVPLLPLLPSLTTLRTYSQNLTRECVAALPNLTYLNLLGTRNLDDILGGCHSLARLDIHGALHLGWAQQPAIRTSLQKLVLYTSSAPRMPSDELGHLIHLHGLRELSLYHDNFIQDCTLNERLQRIHALHLPQLHTITVRD
jgi:hypothetical protein